VCVVEEETHALKYECLDEIRLAFPQLAYTLFAELSGVPLLKHRHKDPSTVTLFILWLPLGPSRLLNSFICPIQDPVSAPSQLRRSAQVLSYAAARTVRSGDLSLLPYLLPMQVM
jgi:hypothetical protein